MTLLAQLEAIEDDESLADAFAGSVDPLDVTRGLISMVWRQHRHIGRTQLDPALQFADLATAFSLQYLRQTLASLAAKLNLSDIDLSAVTSQHRQFTQACARHIYDVRDDGGRPRFAGIRYLSRFNPHWACWAIFDDRFRHAPGWPSRPEPIAADDTDLLEVASIFRLTIEALPGHYLRP
jgi:hypothetical protein